MLFDKWYFDFQNEHMFGYYYVGSIRMAGLCITFCEAHQTGETLPLEINQMGMRYKKTVKTLLSSHADVRFAPDRTELNMRLKSGLMNACWDHSAGPLSQISKPLYRNEDGECLWKVWTPRAEVAINFSGDQPYQFTGTGYIDYVRLSIPLWKIPFRTLHWGRLFAEDGEWIVLFHLQTTDREWNYVASGEGWQSGTSPNIQMGEGRRVQKFIWDTGRELLEIEPVEILQKDKILNSGRIRLIPDRLARKLSRNGFERKYIVKSTFYKKRFQGIMEEVQWNGT